MRGGAAAGGRGWLAPADPPRRQQRQRWRRQRPAGWPAGFDSRSSERRPGRSAAAGRSSSGDEGGCRTAVETSAPSESRRRGRRLKREVTHADTGVLESPTRTPESWSRPRRCSQWNPHSCSFDVIPSLTPTPDVLPSPRNCETSELEVVSRGTVRRPAIGPRRKLGPSRPCVAVLGRLGMRGSSVCVCPDSSPGEAAMRTRPAIFGAENSTHRLRRECA